METATINEVLGGPDVLHRKIKNRMDLVELGKQGITKDALLQLARYLNISIDQMTEIITVTRRTVQRYTLKRHFNRIISEQILQVADAAARGTNAFGNKEKFLAWLHQPNRALGGKPPLSLMGSRFGTEMVLDELGRIEYGVFS